MSDGSKKVPADQISVSSSGSSGSEMEDLSSPNTTCSFRLQVNGGVVVYVHVSAFPSPHTLSHVFLFSLHSFVVTCADSGVFVEGFQTGLCVQNNVNYLLFVNNRLILSRRTNACGVSNEENTRKTLEDYVISLHKRYSFKGH